MFSKIPPFCYMFSGFPARISDMRNRFSALSIKTKEMTENSCTSNDCRFIYMPDFILKPGGKLEYQDNASLLKFKGNPSMDTCRKSSVSKGLDPHLSVQSC